MAEDYDIFPTASQYQEYLERYVQSHGLESCVRLSTEVVKAEYDASTAKWWISTRTANGDESTSIYDVLFICNGTLCDPDMPDFIGQDDFEKAGGQVVHSSRFARDVKQDITSKDLVVLGYGKSSCDLAVGVSDRAKSTVSASERLSACPSYRSTH